MRGLFKINENGVKVEVSPDSLEAYVIVPEDTKVPVRRLIDALKEKGIVRGIIKENLADVVLGKRSGKVLAARVSPKKPHVEYFFDVTSPLPVVEKGEKIAEVKPYFLDVLGNKKPVQSTPEEWAEKIAGENVYADGRSLIAEESGEVKIDSSGRLSIEPVFHLIGDLEPRQSPLEFPGAVVIEGDVKDGASVVAGGDVLVKGAVGKARITGKDIHIIGGVSGASLKGRKIQISFCDSSQVHSDGDIIIKKHSTNSVLYSSRDIIFAPESSMLGGLASAVRQIILGSGRGAGKNLRLAVGLPPKLREEFESLYEDIQKVKEALEVARMDLDSLYRKGEYDSESERVDKFREKEKKLRTEYSQKAERFAEIKRIIQKQSFGTGAVVIRGKIRDADITLFTRTVQVLEEICDIAFVYLGGKISILSAREYDENRRKFGLA